MTHPYREPEPCEVPFTDEEVSFWDLVYGSVISREGYGSDGAGLHADAAVAARRKRFGVRGVPPTGGTSDG